MKPAMFPVPCGETGSERKTVSASHRNECVEWPILLPLASIRSLFNPVLLAQAMINDDLDDVYDVYGFNTYEPSNPAPRGHQPRRNGDFASLINSIAYEFSFCKDFSGGQRALFEVLIIRLHGRRLSERLMRAALLAQAPIPPSGRSPRSRLRVEAGRTARACRSARRPAAKVRRGSHQDDRICGAGGPACI